MPKTNREQKENWLLILKTCVSLFARAHVTDELEEIEPDLTSGIVTKVKCVLCKHDVIPVTSSNGQTSFQFVEEHYLKHRFDLKNYIKKAVRFTLISADTVRINISMLYPGHENNSNQAIIWITDEKFVHQVTGWISDHEWASEYLTNWCPFRSWHELRTTIGHLNNWLIKVHFSYLNFSKQNGLWF